MKNLFASLLFIFLIVNSNATDYTVQDGAPTGTYGSITAAISAASDGDRIIIHPKVGGNAWIENLTINKSLEIISAQDSTHYKIQGDITIVANTGREVSIVGAHLTAGKISYSGTGWKTTVNIMGCILDGGDIDFDNQFYVNAVSNILDNGDIKIANGNIIGNDIKNYNSIEITNSNVGDTMNIIANKVGNIFCNANIVLYIRNNLLINPNNATGITAIEYTYSTLTHNLFILNNSISYAKNGTGSYANRFYDISCHFTIKNNVFVGTGSSSYGPEFSRSSALIIYSSSNNYFYNTASYPIATIPVNTISLSSNPINNEGRLILPTPAQNGADPSFEFYDLDLTVGDAGCYGGSYTLDNYFPITGSSRVYTIDMPFGITSNSSFDIKASGFDR